MPKMKNKEKLTQEAALAKGRRLLAAKGFEGGRLCAYLTYLDQLNKPIGESLGMALLEKLRRVLRAGDYEAAPNATAPAETMTDPLYVLAVEKMENFITGGGLPAQMVHEFIESLNESPAAPRLTVVRIKDVIAFIDGLPDPAAKPARKQVRRKRTLRLVAAPPAAPAPAEQRAAL